MNSDFPALVPQSPVNISTSDTSTQSFDTVLDSNYQSSPVEIFNNGKNIDGEFGTEQNFVTYQGERYYLNEFHFHTSSEHSFNGQTADGEIHLVHTSSTGKNLVVGILLDGVAANSPDGNLINPELTSFLGQLDQSLQEASTIIEGGEFDPSQLIANDTQVYNYGGSLTTAPFTDVAWVVAAQPLLVNESDLQNFSNLQNSFYNNNGLNNRDIQNELFIGTNGDDFLQGDRNGVTGFSDDLIYARNGNDSLNGGIGNDKLYGEGGEDIIFAGSGDDLLVGDNNLTGINSDSYATDILIGGDGQDQLYLDGDDLAVGGASNRFDADLIELLNDEPFEAESNFFDQQQDTFTFANNGNGYTATIVGFEAGIDQLDLKQYNLGSVDSPQSFQSIEQQGENENVWWEYKTANVNGAEVVLRIDADPNAVNAALV